MVYRCLCMRTSPSREEQSGVELCTCIRMAFSLACAHVRAQAGRQTP
uniref:Uncharacterized protein n=1 Tax=Anguilla anguilla TaxID=7936 RepID=A0A0E9QZX7_ANGAN